MHQYQCFKLNQSAVLAALLVGAVASAQAASYSNLYIFGDSLSDSGTFGPILDVGRNARFTTKPGTVWAENLGASYGLSVTPAYTAEPGRIGPLVFSLNASGNNFAVGDARINAAPPNLSEAVNLPSVRMQVDGFLARGPLDSNALYVVSGGHNDVFAQLGGSPVAAQTAMITAANDLTAQVTRLQSAGARNLIVVGIMDISQTPIGRAQTPTDAAQLNDLITTFETSLTSGLAGKNLLYFDTGRLLDTVLANPAAYGFTNTTDPACGEVNALQCQVPADGHLFADNKHPSTSMHSVISDWVSASLDGANRMGLLSQVALASSSAQWNAIDTRMLAFQNFWLPRPGGLCHRRLCRVRPHCLCRFAVGG